MSWVEELSIQSKLNLQIFPASPALVDSPKRPTRSRPSPESYATQPRSSSIIGYPSAFKKEAGVPSASHQNPPLLSASIQHSASGTRSSSRHEKQTIAQPTMDTKPPPSPSPSEMDGLDSLPNGFEHLIQHNSQHGDPTSYPQDQLTPEMAQSMDQHGSQPGSQAGSRYGSPVPHGLYYNAPSPYPQPHGLAYGYSPAYPDPGPYGLAPSGEAVVSRGGETPDCDGRRSVAD